MRYAPEDHDGSEGNLARGFLVGGTLGLLLWVVIAMLALGTAKGCHASPLYFSIETGGHAFKWMDNTYYDGAPKFDRLKWTFDAAFEWAPQPLHDRGFTFLAGFRYVSLGESKYTWVTYVDGPRVALKWRGKLTP